MPASFPPDQHALAQSSMIEIVDGEEAPSGPHWIWFFIILAGAIGIFSLGAWSNARSTKPDLAGPFENDASSSKPLVVHVAGRVLKPGVYEFGGNARVRDAIQKAGGPMKDADLNSVNLAEFLEDGKKILVQSKQSTPVAAAPVKDAAPDTDYSLPAPTNNTFAPMPELSPRESESETKPEKTAPRATLKSERKEKIDKPKKELKKKVLPNVPRGSTPGGQESQNADPKYFEKHPLNLNTATQEQLELLPGVGPAMAAKILAARKAKGGFKSVDELDDIRGVGEKRMEELRPLVTVS